MCGGRYSSRKWMRMTFLCGSGKRIYVSIYIYVSDTPATRPEADKAGQSPRGR